MKQIRFILASLFIIHCLYQGYKLVRDEFTPTNTTECGTITFKGNRDQVNKHSTSVEFILVVDYDNVGKKDVEVTASTWSSYNVGDRICFISHKPLASFGGGIVGFINVAIGMITAFVIVVIIVFACLDAIIWLFRGKIYFFNSDFSKDDNY
jgi:hypothetical protein